MILIRCYYKTSKFLQMFGLQNLMERKDKVKRKEGKDVPLLWKPLSRWQEHINNFLGKRIIGMIHKLAHLYRTNF